jgi:biopolymer transport protein ExbD
MKLRRSRSYRRGCIEIIPMIDVMFFLLVTFMLASLSMQAVTRFRHRSPSRTIPDDMRATPRRLSRRRPISRFPITATLRVPLTQPITAHG